MEAAQRFGYKIKVIRIVVDPQTAFERNAHGVPLDKIKQMFESLISSPHMEGEVVVNPGE